MTTYTESVVVEEGYALMYRVECKKTGRGAYRGSDISSIAGLSDSVDSFSHPTPTSDAGIRDLWDRVQTEEYVFGFTSIDQYLGWFMFDYGREAAAEVGCVAVYRVSKEHEDNFCKGQFQAIALLSKMELIKKLDMHTLEVIETS